VIDEAKNSSSPHQLALRFLISSNTQELWSHIKKASEETANSGSDVPVNKEDIEAEQKRLEEVSRICSI